MFNEEYILFPLLIIYFPSFIPINGESGLRTLSGLEAYGRRGKRGREAGFHWRNYRKISCALETAKEREAEVKGTFIDKFRSLRLESLATVTNRREAKKTKKSEVCMILFLSLHRCTSHRTVPSFMLLEVLGKPTVLLLPFCAWILEMFYRESNPANIAYTAFVSM